MPLYFNKPECKHRWANNGNCHHTAFRDSEEAYCIKCGRRATWRDRLLTKKWKGDSRGFDKGNDFTHYCNCELGSWRDDPTQRCCPGAIKLGEEI